MAEIKHEIKPRLNLEAHSALFHAEMQATQLGVTNFTTRQLLKSLLHNNDNTIARILAACNITVEALNSYIIATETNDRENAQSIANEKDRFKEVSKLFLLRAAAVTLKQRREISYQLRTQHEWYYEPCIVTNALNLAFDEARKTNTSHAINSGHLLLGLLREPYGFAGVTLRSMGLEIESARKALIAISDNK